MKSWLTISNDSDFSIYNLPFGIFSTSSKSPRIGVAIGDYVIDLEAARALGIIEIDSDILINPFLNDFISLGKEATNQVRLLLQRELTDPNSPLRNSDALVSQSDVKMHMPVRVGDYTDFYSSIEHATNVGKMFRDPENALLPNWKHIPVGYHGRASSIVESGVPLKRPKGQVLPKGESVPRYEASSRVDFELEMAFIVGKDTDLGSPVSTEKAADHIFGMVLFNDWSARDIQKWEYVPLGPFLGKNFGSSVSPWVVTMEALEEFKVAGPSQEPKVLPYLEYSGQHNYDINLEVSIQPKGTEETVVSKSNYRYMYWNMVQQLAHHTVNGCNIKVGDMMASGTISGKDETSYGSMLEIAWAGTKPIMMPDGSSRKFIHDYDTVTMRGFAQNGEKRVGFGKVTCQILPADE